MARWMITVEAEHFLIVGSGYHEQYSPNQNNRNFEKLTNDNLEN